MTPAQRTCILVVGMHRSGTSATAGALALCDVTLGETLLAPGVDNPKGYFEHERAVEIDERLLSALGSGWADVRPLPVGWQDGAAARAAIAEIGALLDEDFAGASMFALKDPRLCRVMPVWLQALRQRGVTPVALFVARDPTEVAASIQARNGWATPMGGLLWLRYTCEAEAASRDIARTALSYDALLAEPGAALRESLARVNVELPKVPEAALRSFVDAGERHQRGAPAGAASGGAFDAPVLAAAAALDAVAAGSDAWAGIATAGVTLQREWTNAGGLLDALATMAKDTARLQDEAKAQATWADQAVVRQEALHADIARLGSELTAQVAWSEAAVEQREALQADNARLQSELTAQIRWSEQAVADWTQRAAGYQVHVAELETIKRSLAWRLARPLRALEAAMNSLFKRMTGRNHTP